jgi:hypothetical protein
MMEKSGSVEGIEALWALHLKQNRTKLLNNSSPNAVYLITSSLSRTSGKHACDIAPAASQISGM